MTVDADGRVLSVTVSQPRFTRREKALLLASRRDELSRGKHGFLLSEAMDPANQFKFYAVGPHVDYADKAVLDAERRYAEANKGANMHGVRFRAAKR